MEQEERSYRDDVQRCVLQLQYVGARYELGTTVYAPFAIPAPTLIQRQYIKQQNIMGKQKGRQQQISTSNPPPPATTVVPLL